MKNLFDFATKELSQDAFLRWLFENYETLKKDQIFTKKLLGLFSNEDYRNKEITIIETSAQYKSVIDVAIKYKVDNIEHLLVMENKTQSYIHSDQLDRYYKLIESEDKSYKRHYCYFKANRLDYSLSKKDNEDLDYLKKHKEWNKVTLKDIYEVVKEHKSSDFLFYQWIEHITMLYEMYYELKHYKSWDIRAYQIFLNTELKENFKKENGWIWYGNNFFSQGNCLYFWATRKSDEEDYIELQMQYRLKEKNIWADLRYFTYEGNKQVLIKDEAKTNRLKKVIEEKLSNYFVIRKKASTKVASYENEPRLYEMNKEQLVSTINNIRKIMEREL